MIYDDIESASSSFKQVKAWCSEKGSAWFTKRDVKRILKRSSKVVDHLVRRWQAFGDIAHRKGSAWYTIVPKLQSTPHTGPNYRVDFDRIKTPRFHDVSTVQKPTDPAAVRGVKADRVFIDEIQSHDMDIRKIHNELMLKDIQADD